ncbi:branched-chain-amino-acid aminotransferase, mitochondrial isoform X2 [Arvicola amphibius]|uniref:branched-chain-amino-acid aminotransferase, mitochondrial isoform X2 n=1 Tax=Arvicola amphibius TaxID=1047088 RepID=UPI0018E2FE89|nr:branched-chain-amino-acid aminotransferase, mitochondrial isoform X2 [Arvicola amphibius]
MVEGRELTLLFLGIVILVGTWAEHRVCLECAGTVTEPASWASPARGGSWVPGRSFCLLPWSYLLLSPSQVQAPKLLPVSWFLCGPRRCVSSNFKASDLQVQVTREPQKKPGPSQPLLFGKTFTDHMLMVEWTKKTGWSRPRIQPFQNLTLHPACSALHYSLQLFEGLKAYKGRDQQVRLFRPWLNMDRMLRSARRLCLPDFDKQELLECIRRLIEVDKDWVPDGHGSSLYVRPVLIGNEPSLGVGLVTQALLFVILCPVGSYFPGDSMTPVSLLADPTFIRAWMGGVGDYKVGGNYGPTVALQQEAQKKGCEQVLWLYGPDHQLTEVGTMNIFVYWTHEDGVLELATPPLDGIILPGVVRQSLLDLARTWGEFRVAERKVTMKELKRALEEGRVREVFGSGTACQVCPVHQILYEGKQLHIPTMENGPELILRFQKELKAIQYGASAHDWMFPV